MRRKQYNDYRFLSPMGNRLAELGLNVTDVSPGRYVQIDLSKDRSQEPEEFAMYGEFDTFTVLNPQDISSLDVLLYINNNRPQSAMPLKFISHLDTIADRFFLQHSPAPGKTLHLILGGDMRAMNVTPTNQGAFKVLNLDAAELKIENVIQGEGADGDPNAWSVKGTVNQGLAGAYPWKVQGTINQGQAGEEPWPITGTINGSVTVANTLTQKGSVIVDSYSDTGNKTITLTTPAHGLSIVNDDANSNLNFTVNGKTFIVNAYESFDGIFKQFSTIEIVASGPWRLIIKEGDNLGDIDETWQNTVNSSLTNLEKEVAFLTRRVKFTDWKDVQDIVRAGLGDKVFQIGGQIETEFAGTPVVADIIGINHDKPSDPRFNYSLTLQFHDCLLNAQFDAPEPDNPDSNRQEYGNNRYLHSAIRQWLNSEEEEFTWQAQHQYDVAPTGAPYDGPGFLKLLDPELVAVLGAVDKQVARNTVTDGGGQDLFSDKVFLLSRVEVYGGTDGVTTGEAPYPYYESLAPSSTTNTLDGRIKYLDASAQYWWLRSPTLASANRPRGMGTNGSVSDLNVLYSYGVAPAVVIV